MAEQFESETTAAAIDIGAYCRQVEDHLTRGNAGHLVRIVGPGFELVRGWATEGIPLSVVYRGIDRKLERHRAGRAARPLRVEFCEADVREVYDHWRRAVGLGGREVPSPGRSGDDETRRPSLPKHLDRVIQRLSGAAGRLDVPDLVRDTIGELLTELSAIRETAKKVRGEAREAIAARLAVLDRELGDRAREAAPPDLLATLESQARVDLAAFRSRLSPDRWLTAMTATVDRLLRDRWGLPTLDL